MTLTDFLNNTVESGLLTREQLGEALRRIPAEARGDPQSVAQQLIFAGQLTDFQAKKLLEGIKRGFVLGPFRVLAPLARGGMGAVFLARDTRGGQLVALKVLPPKKARDGERHLFRFRREMELSQKLAHPNIAYVYEIGVAQGIHYLALEYIPGQSVQQLVEKQGPLAWEQAAPLFAQVALALGHAHERGLIHRDVKPGNVMVTPEGVAKLLDFGLALIPGELEMVEVVGGQGYVIGTMDYIPPEQVLDSSRADERSDLYGLGAALYFALTGRPPFPGGTKKQKMRRHLRAEPEPLERLAPAVPPAGRELVRRLMAKLPDERPGPAQEVAALLRE